LQMEEQLSFKAAASGAAGPQSAASAPSSAVSASPRAGKPIVLYCDLAIDPRREQEMLDHFHREFKPAAEKFEGFIDLKLVKLRKVIQGTPAPPPEINYRFQLTYQSEELRQRWIASEVHQRVWPLIENTVTNNYLVLLTDSV
jgi:hypothetical protein